MTRYTLPAALALALGLGLPAMASDDERIPQETRAAITEKLTAEGYELRKLEMEDGRYEAYATKDGKRFEIYLDRDLNVTRTESK